MKLRALVEQIAAQHFVDEDGQQVRFELLAPLHVLTTCVIRLHVSHG